MTLDSTHPITTPAVGQIGQALYRLSFWHGFVRGAVREAGGFWRALRILGAFWLKGQCEWVLGGRICRPTLKALQAEAASEYALSRLRRSAEAERFALRFPPPSSPYLN